MHDLAITVTTVCRQSLLRAIRSVFGQTGGATIQILIGVDRDPHGRLEAMRETLAAECPSHITLTWLDLGYSTSQRHGGVHACHFGGSLAAAMTLLADAPIAMSLDDDDWLAPAHCADILKAIAKVKWAFAYCYFADGDKGVGLCIDEVESVGVGRGAFAEKFGGYVRPSGLAMRTLPLLDAVHLWAMSPFSNGGGADRLIFDRLKGEPHRCTGAATVYYSLDPRDMLHQNRLAFMRSRGVNVASLTKAESVR